MINSTYFISNSEIDVFENSLCFKLDSANFVVVKISV